MSGAQASGTIDLSGKVILVTGGARGIGYAVAELARDCGAAVALCDIDRDEANAAAHRLGPDVLGMVADVAREDHCTAALQGVLARFGRLDVLVNSAGVLQQLRGTLRQEPSDWRRVIDVNLHGTFLMAQAAARAMAAQRVAGTIINIASVAGLVGFRASNAYGVSKAGVVMLTQTLATDLACRGIRVNAVAPGFVRSAMTASLASEPSLAGGAIERRIPMGRLGNPDELARAVIFLASDWSSYVTGVVLPVDGGLCAFGGPGDASGGADQAG
jgi:NAD(P)-dependent dehydrogenase (short-subunit alcohol dehydrogenase family)